MVGGLPQSIEPHVAAWLRRPARSLTRVESAGGSGFAQTALLYDDDGVAAFAKWNTSSDVFEAEALALERLAASGALRVPSRPVVYREPTCLVMEAIETGARSATFERRLGRGLAELHRSSPNERFGFDRPTFLGATRQSNAWTEDWSSFFLDQRLEPQLRDVRGMSSELDRRTEELLRRAEDLLGSLRPIPQLIHGDLWSGNVLCDAAGEPALIDPAACYAHSELELGMTTLFGGFGSDFYGAYHEILPADPGTHDRVSLYRLLHLLNHVNLFGSSYLRPSLDLARRLC